MELSGEDRGGDPSPRLGMRQRAYLVTTFQDQVTM